MASKKITTAQQALPTPDPPPVAVDDLEQMLRRAGTFVIGLTGPFGSGCSTAAHLLATGDLGFAKVKLSDVLRAGAKNESPTRSELQDLGNALRQTEGNESLVVRGLGGVVADGVPPARVVVDGIRNLGEVRWLQTVLGDRFSLFAVVAEAERRFERRPDASQSLVEFEELDQRDQGESEDHGQQVSRCVDYADVVIANDAKLETWEMSDKFGAKVTRYARLVLGEEHPFASNDETLMNVAYGASHGSRCIKRQVGAVIARGGEVIATGYNENPAGLKPCIDGFGACYRDMVRDERFVGLAKQGARCPYCSTAIPRPLMPPWDCVSCGKSLDRAFFPDRAMKWCTALHAEERAIINATGRALDNATLYTTTFPCMLCAEKVIHAGIRSVVYVDPYPDTHGIVLFSQAAVKTRRFEGVRSRNFERYFSGTQPSMEQAGHKKLLEIINLREKK